jgi:GxxExxY protein
MLYEDLSHKILDAALKVHSNLGPGLFEEVYKACLRHELTKSGLSVRSEVDLPVFYDGVNLNIGYRLDLLVQDTIILELKSVEHLAPLHKAQLLTYLKIAHKEVGLLLNFNTAHLKDGITRVVNSFPPPRPSRPPR